MMLLPEHAANKFQLYIGHTGRPHVPSPFEMNFIILALENKGVDVKPGFVDSIRRSLRLNPNFLLNNYGVNAFEER